MTIPEKKRISKKDREDLDRLVRSGVVSPDKPGKKKTTYSTRIIPDGGYASDTYPGFLDHPSTQGIEYTKHIDQSPAGSLWTALASLAYAEGGFPTWIRVAVSDLDLSVYWQMVHYQYLNDGEARMSVRTLSRNLSRPYRSIQRCISRLLEVGLIIQTRKNSGRKSSAYKVIPASSIKPHEVTPRRSDSGFKRDSALVEVTAESVEVTAENGRGDRADTQKTKPLKGVVGEVGASAPFATTTQKSDLTTIDELRKKKEKERKRAEYSQQIKTIRYFHQREVTPEILRSLLNNSPSLRNSFDTAIDLNTRLGVFTEALGACEPGVWSNPDQVIERLSRKLQSNQFDIRELGKAFESVLASHLDAISKQAARVESDFKYWEVKQEKRREEEKRRQYVERERLEAEARKREARLQPLNDIRARLLSIFPDSTDQVDNWGSVHNFISHHSGRTMGVHEIECDLSQALAKYSGASSWRDISDPKRIQLLEDWFTSSLK